MNLFKKIYYTKLGKILAKKLPSPVCPYCNYLFSERPKRSSKCPKCNNKFVVDNFSLVTLQQKMFLEAEKYTRVQNISSDRITSYLEKKPNSTLNDILWSIFQEKILEIKSLPITIDRASALGSLYGQLARIARNENKNFTIYESMSQKYFNEEHRLTIESIK